MPPGLALYGLPDNSVLLTNNFCGFNQFRGVNTRRTAAAGHKWRKLSSTARASATGERGMAWGKMRVASR